MVDLWPMVADDVHTGTSGPLLHTELLTSGTLDAVYRGCHTLQPKFVGSALEGCGGALHGHGTAGSPPSLSAAVRPARRSVMVVLAIVAQHLAWVFLSWSACCLTGKYGSSGAAQQVLEPRSFIIVKSHRRLLQVQGHQKSRMFRELVRVVSFKLCCELSWSCAEFRNDRYPVSMLAVLS